MGAAVLAAPSEDGAELQSCGSTCAFPEFPVCACRQTMNLWRCAPRSSCKAHLERQELSYVYVIEILLLNWVSPLSSAADVPEAQDMFYQIFKYEYHGGCLVDYMEGINY